MVQEMSFKGITYLELWRPIFRPSKSICAILVEDIMRNISVRPVVHEMLLKDIFHLELW